MATGQDRAPETTGHSTNANIWAALLCLTQMVLFSQATEAAQSPSEQTQLNQEHEVLERGLAGLHVSSGPHRHRKGDWHKLTCLQSAENSMWEMKEEQVVWKCFKVKQNTSHYFHH